MDSYNKLAQQISRKVTKHYSTSFGLAIKLLPASVRPDIYNIYGLVRIADEIVDSYKGYDAEAQLKGLENEVYNALLHKYSANLVVHAFVQTALKYDIKNNLIAPFFFSMQLDTRTQKYDKNLYKKYIEGSAEVVGLMCLKVFVQKRDEFDRLEPGARALGSAFQKVNFLRDFAADYIVLNRIYFPGITYESFDDTTKKALITDIEKDFSIANVSIEQLPKTAKPAVRAAYNYYNLLLRKISNSSAMEIKNSRIRISDATKIRLFSKTYISSKFSGIKP